MTASNATQTLEQQFNGGAAEMFSIQDLKGADA
jgi:hypothetical protein